MDYNLSGSSDHGIFQARILEWVAISFSRGSSQARDQTQVSCIAGRCFTIWAIAPENWCFWTVVLKKTRESPLDGKEIQPVNPKGNQPWIFIRRTDAEAEMPILWPPATKKLTYLKRPWCLQRLKAGGERDDRGWGGWMGSPTQWTWLWVNCGSWWWTGRPGVPQSMGSQRVGHDWAIELNWEYWLLIVAFTFLQNYFPFSYGIFQQLAVS